MSKIKKREWSTEQPPPGAYLVRRPGKKTAVGIMRNEGSNASLLVADGERGISYNMQMAEDGQFAYSPIDPRSGEDDADSPLPRPLGSHVALLTVDLKRRLDHHREWLQAIEKEGPGTITAEHKKSIEALQSRLKTDIAAGADTQVRVLAAESREQCRHILTDNFRPALREQVAAIQERIIDLDDWREKLTEANAEKEAQDQSALIHTLREQIAAIQKWIINLDEWRVEVIAEKKAYRLENNDRFNSGVEYANGLQERAETHDKCSEALESRVADALHRIAELEPTVWRLNGIEHDSAKTYEPDPNAGAVDQMLRDSAKAREANEVAAPLVWTTDRPPSPGPYLCRRAKRAAVMMRVFLVGKNKTVLHGMRPEDPSPGIPLSDDEFWGDCEFAGPVAMPTSGDVPMAGQVPAWSPDLPTEPGLYWVRHPSRASFPAFICERAESTNKGELHLDPLRGVTVGPAVKDNRGMMALDQWREYLFLGPLLFVEHEVPDAS